MLVSTMSESPSGHSSKLFFLARSLSGLGIDAANGGPITPTDNDEPPPPVKSPSFVPDTLGALPDYQAPTIALIT